MMLRGHKWSSLVECVTHDRPTFLRGKRPIGFLANPGRNSRGRRADTRIQIAVGRVTLDEVREKNRERVKKFREKKERKNGNYAIFHSNGRRYISQMKRSQREPHRCAPDRSNPGRTPRGVARSIS